MEPVEEINIQWCCFLCHYIEISDWPEFTEWQQRCKINEKPIGDPTKTPDWCPLEDLE